MADFCRSQDAFDGESKRLLNDGCKRLSLSLAYSSNGEHVYKCVQFRMSKLFLWFSITLKGG